MGPGIQKGAGVVILREIMQKVMQPTLPHKFRVLLHVSLKHPFCKSPSDLFEIGHFKNVHFLKPQPFLFRAFYRI